MTKTTTRQIILSILMACLLTIWPLSARAAGSGDAKTGTENLRLNNSETAVDLKMEAVETYPDHKGNYTGAYRKTIDRQDAAGSETPESFSDYLDDASITTAVKTKFLAENGLDSLDISVETTQGVVTLRGQVENQAQSALAEVLAGESGGVTGVVNDLTARQ